MSAITIDLPDDLVERLRGAADRLPRTLELGLLMLRASARCSRADAGWPSARARRA